MLIVKAILAVIINLIVYFAIGSLIVSTKDERRSAILCMGTGFFVYYGLFFICVLPLMFTYRTLSTLTLIWGIAVGAIVAVAIILRGRIMAEMIREAAARIKSDRKCAIILAVIIILQTFIIVRSYDFTLDAAYYVANVTTTLDTDMINIYDPFTGAWQDHFELRYAFATYSINDAFLCRVFGLPALVGTKTVMASTVAILSNIMYLGISDELFRKDTRKVTVMMTVICWVNFTFVTLYTASNFLITRTYEGKAVLGNITVPFIFLLFTVLLSEDVPKHYWLMLFAAAFGSTTITSSANMLVPAEISILLIPYIIMKKKWKLIPKWILMLLPGVVMMGIYVLYVKGYFAISTYYRR